MLVNEPARMGTPVVLLLFFKYSGKLPGERRSKEFLSG
jgi:hypothetical protein